MVFFIIALQNGSSKVCISEKIGVLLLFDNIIHISWSIDNFQKNSSTFLFTASA